MSDTPRYGVYMHYRPEGRIFYVGKGTRTRAFSLAPANRSTHHANIVAKYGRENIVVKFILCATESLAFKVEIALIAAFKKVGAGLCNTTLGGEGPSGSKHTEENKRLLSELAKKQFSDPKQREIQRNTKLAQYKNPEYYRRICEINREISRRPGVSERVRLQFLGKKLTAEQEARRVAGLKRAYAENPELVEHMRAINKKRGETPEFRKRISEVVTERMRDPKNREIVSKATKGTVWMSDGVTNARVKPDELDLYLEKGYKRGRIYTRKPSGDICQN